MEHAAVEEKLAGFVDGGVDAFHGFAAIDVGVQHLGNRNFAEIALDCVWCSKQGFFVLAEIFVFSGIGEGVFGGFFQAE